MSIIKNRKLWSILLLVIPLAIGIPLAIYFIPSVKPKTPVQSHFDKVPNPNDNIDIKLDYIFEKLNQLDIRLKKMEASKAITKDTIEHPIKSVQQKKQSPQVKSTELKSKHSNSTSKQK